MKLIRKFANQTLGLAIIMWESPPCRLDLMIRLIVENGIVVDWQIHGGMDRGLIAYRVQYFSNHNGVNRAFNGPI